MLVPLRDLRVNPMFCTSSAAFMMLSATLASKPNSLLTSAAAFFKKPNARITGAYQKKDKNNNTLRITSNQMISHYYILLNDAQL